MRTTVPPSKKHIVEWLKRRLADGPVLSEELMREAASLDISPSRLRTAGRSIGVSPWKDGYQGKWYWGLPSGEQSALERELGVSRAEVVYPSPKPPPKSPDPFDFSKFLLSNYVKDKEE